MSSLDFSSATKTITEVVPFDSFADAGGVIVDVVSDAADSVADVALIAGRQGTRITVRAVRYVWSNRKAAAIVVVLLGAVAAVAVWRRQSGNDASAGQPALD